MFTECLGSRICSSWLLTLENEGQLNIENERKTEVEQIFRIIAWAICWIMVPLSKLKNNGVGETFTFQKDRYSIRYLYKSALWLTLFPATVLNEAATAYFTRRRGEHNIFTGL